MALILLELLVGAGGGPSGTLMILTNTFILIWEKRPVGECPPAFWFFGFLIISFLQFLFRFLPGVLSVLHSHVVALIVLFFHGVPVAVFGFLRYPFWFVLLFSVAFAFGRSFIPAPPLTNGAGQLDQGWNYFYVIFWYFNIFLVPFLCSPKEKEPSGFAFSYARQERKGALRPASSCASHIRPGPFRTRHFLCYRREN